MDVPAGNRLTIRMPGNIRELVFQHSFPEDTEKHRSGQTYTVPCEVTGTDPTNWSWMRDNAVARPLSSEVTPPHSLIGTSLSQLLLRYQSGPPVAALPQELPLLPVSAWESESVLEQACPLEPRLPRTAAQRSGTDRRRRCGDGRESRRDRGIRHPGAACFPPQPARTVWWREGTTGPLPCLRTSGTL